MLKRREFLASGAAIATGLIVPMAGCATKDSDITFANPTPVWWNAVPLIAEQRHFYEKAHVRVVGFEVPSGVRSKKAIVDGNAQMGVASPNAISTSSNDELKNLQILASVTRSSSTVSIISKRPQPDLLGSRIGYVKGTISEFYLIAYLLKSGQIDLYRQRHLQLVDLPPPNLLTAFARGDIDTAVAWEPFATQIAIEARKSAPPTIIRDETLYTQHILVISSPRTPAAPRDHVLFALRNAASFITNHKDEVGEELEKYFGFPVGFLTRSEPWSTVSFSYDTNRNTILQSLQRDLELAREAGIAKTDGSSFSALLDALR